MLSTPVNRSSACCSTYAELRERTCVLPVTVLPEVLLPQPSHLLRMSLVSHNMPHA